MFKNILFSIISLLCIGLLAIPYLTGMGAEQQFSYLNQQIEQTSSAKLVDSHYARGWFTSQAQSVFSWQTASAQASPITLEHTIEHGLQPVRPTKIFSRLQIDPTFYPALIYQTNTKELVTVETVIQADGHGISTVEMPALMIKEKNVQWQWQALLGTITFHQNIFSRKLTQLQTDIQIPHLQLTTDTTQLSADNVTFNANLADESHLLPTGKFALAQLQLIENNVPIKIIHWEITNHNTIVNDNLTVLLQSNVEKIQLENEQYGPGKIILEVNNLPMSDLQTIFAKIIAGLQVDFSEQQAQRTLLSASLQHGFSLIKNSPELIVKQLTLHTPEGELTARFNIKLGQLSVLALLQHSLLLNALEGKMEINLPHGIVYRLARALLTHNNKTRQPIEKEQIERLVNIWVSNELLIEETSNHYVSHLTLQQGILQINTRSFALADLLQ